MSFTSVGSKATEVRNSVDKVFEPGPAVIAGVESRMPTPSAEVYEASKKMPKAAEKSRDISVSLFTIMNDICEGIAGRGQSMEILTI